MKVFTINDSSPEFVELQVLSFRKHMEEDFEFILLNGGEKLGTQPDKAAEVTRICNDLGVQVIDIQRDKAIEEERYANFSNGNDDRLFTREGRYVTGVGGHACNYMLQWAWQHVIARERGPICFMHSDIFLVEPITLSDYLKRYDICSVLNSQPSTNVPGTTLTFLWEAFLLANPHRLPEPERIRWWPSRIEGSWMDTGAPTHQYMKNHPELKIMPIGQTAVFDDPARSFHPTRYQFFHFGEKRVFHYQSGSKWCTDLSLDGCWSFSKEKSDEYHARKLEWTRELIGL
jgi:hypothetical protein